MIYLCALHMYGLYGYVEAFFVFVVLSKDHVFSLLTIIETANSNEN
jgi:hypothetical protein